MKIPKPFKVRRGGKQVHGENFKFWEVNDLEGYVFNRVFMDINHPHKDGKDYAKVVASERNNCFLAGVEWAKTHKNKLDTVTR